MGIQRIAKNEELIPVWEYAREIKEIRASQERTMKLLQKALALNIRTVLLEGRTDFVTAQEIKTALRSGFQMAGFSTSRKELEKYL